MTKHKSDLAVIIRPSGIQVIVSGILCTIFAILCLFPIVTLIGFVVDYGLRFGGIPIPSTDDLGIIFGSLLVYLLPVTIAWSLLERAFFSRVIISPEGITVKYFGYYAASWDEMESITYQNFGTRRYSIWGIVTRTPIEIQRNKLQYLMTASFEFQNFLPVGIVSKHDPNDRKFEASEIAEAIDRFAPHLFEEYDEVKLKNELADNYNEAVSSETKVIHKTKAQS